MKNFFNVFATGAITVIGILGGKWLWDEVLQDKANNLKNRLTKK